MSLYKKKWKISFPEKKIPVWDQKPEKKNPELETGKNLSGFGIEFPEKKIPVWVDLEIQHGFFYFLKFYLFFGYK